MSQACPHCLPESNSSETREVLGLVIRKGSFFRKSDQTLQKRYFCKPCEKYFSSASLSPCYRQKKRQLNPDVFRYLVSGVSQRRLAMLLKINRKTIVRKFLFLGSWSQYYLAEHRKESPIVTEMQFDDLETFEHSKLKPLSVVMAVETGTRRILGFKVARMPAKGLLVQRSLKKYGKRKDERKAKRQELFSELQPFVDGLAVIKSDESPHYPACVRNFFPQSLHKIYKGRRGCVVGQGELKAGGFDPIFSLNHSFAMLRASINRLFRRTWNTTKKPERLSAHIAMYALYHNLYLID